MPELPEVETVRRQLAPLVEGRRLQQIEILDARWSRPLEPHELADALRGRRVLELGRRGKYLIWRLEDEVHLVQHLRMTGAVLCDPKPEPAHVRVRIELGPRSAAAARAATATDVQAARRRQRLVIVDPRRFGTGELVLGAEALTEFFAARLGVEPLQEGFTAEHLRTLARGRSAPIKAFLLDQRRIAGVGNIYADEALHRARIHPLRPAGALTRAQHERLRDAVVAALREGIDARGATIDDFRHVDGFRGSFQDRFRVHRRAGEACATCGTTIVKMVVGGRGTYVCERCQPRPRAQR
ncbi:MAG TPA: bifunctional DNA-formamidopyrimidine glycosylase/DNA-(apurinic or apyrimidinic site) lyase [Solirubrobacteraceae bacterium]|jgi:formamidopyrimidine-DNA glycosylase